MTGTLVQHTIAPTDTICSSTASSNGTVAILGSSDGASLDIEPGAKYAYTIQGIAQNSRYAEGFGVREFAAEVRMLERADDSFRE